MLAIRTHFYTSIKSLANNVQIMFVKSKYHASSRCYFHRLQTANNREEYSYFDSDMDMALTSNGSQQT